MSVRIAKIVHRDKPCLKLDFAYDVTKIALVKQIEGYTWSKTLGSWLIPDAQQPIGQPKLLFQGDESLFDGKPAPQYETLMPASPQINPQMGKAGVSIEVINRKILIKMPKNDTYQFYH